MKSIFYCINGSVAVSVYFLNTIFWFIPIFFLSLFKLIPLRISQTWLSKLVDQCATNWISINTFNQYIFSRTKIETNLPPELSNDKWYLVIANHQSWVDILVLQRIFNRKVPFLKFFLKHSLIYVPFLGLAWWGLDFPFMKRYSRAFLRKNPHLRGKDLETTKKACQKFENTPVSIMNFVEGTRFQPLKLKHPNTAKLGLQKTLAPKSGGIAFVLNAMGQRLTEIVNVTICYPKGIPNYWDFVCGRVKYIKVEVETINVKTLYAQGYYSDKYFNCEKQKIQFQTYLNKLWQEKDARLATMQEKS